MITGKELETDSSEPVDKKTKHAKSGLSKTKRLEKELKEERERSKDVLNRLMYLQADFKNYKKRKDKETQELVRSGNEKIIKKLLGVVDELEIAIHSGKKTGNKEAILKGVDMVLNKMYKTLKSEGLTRIEAVGKPFDPKKHESISKVATKDYSEGTVVEELRKGFTLRDKVVRPSLVKISTREGADS